MDEIEAKKILNFIHEEDDLNDLLEDALFDIKQFILSKPIISKLIDSQFKKLAKLEEVTEVLKLKIKESNNSAISLQALNTTTNMLDLVNDFESKKASLKQLLLRTNSISEISIVIQQLLDLQQSYFLQWPAVELKETDSIIISKEPDIMELLTELRKMKEVGINEFHELDVNLVDKFPNVILEMKRLSLLRKKENEWETSLKN